jgi:hypothetical protein
VRHHSDTQLSSFFSVLLGSIDAGVAGIVIDEL